MNSLDETSEFRFMAGDAVIVGRATPLPQVQRLSVPVPGGRSLSALRFGEPEPVEFVLLHGMGMNAHSFDQTVLALGRPALAIDLPGHGRSDWRSDANYPPDLLAKDVVTALDQLLVSGSAAHTPRPVVLVGHSLGALTAILVAAQRPELVRALVLIDLTPGVTPSSDGKSVTEFIAGARAFDTVDEIVDRALAFGIGHDRAALTRGVSLNTRVRPDGKIEWTHHFAHLLPDPDPNPAAPDTNAFSVSAQPFAALWAPLADLAVPITLVRGTTGMVSDALLIEWHERLPNRTVTLLETGHNVQEQDPVGLAEALASAARPGVDQITAT
jgi:pimeloyl-ACP methyl ester carboxylesterase